jgi:ribosome-binding factor A
MKETFENESSMEGTSRHMQRKTRQFCRQVQRALNLALAERSTGNVECDLFVEDVSPAPDCGHLLVHLAIAGGQSIAEAIEAVRSDASRLRADVAMAIARKRAPLLCFVPVSWEGDSND